VFDPLDRPAADYHTVLDVWLTTPDLTVAEASVIRALKTSLNNSLGEFDQMRRIMVGPGFLPHVASAARKAMDAGLLLEWSQYAEAA
jgi:hypothetical protein